MDYNSSREALIIPEYGRNVQNLIYLAKNIEDQEERQAFVERVARLMMQMTPQNKNLDDFKERTWNHLFRIADFELDVKAPEGVVTSREEADKKPEKVPYPTAEYRFRHYGHNVQKLIEKALAMEEGEIRDKFVQAIGSYMKLAYRTWNKDHYVSDEVILGDLESLSDGKLVLRDGLGLDSLTNSNPRKRKSSGRSGGKSSGRQHKGHKGNRKGGKRK